MHVHHRLSEYALSEIRDARKDVIDQRLVLSEMRTPFVGDLVNLLATFLGPRSRVTQILEHRQRWVDRSRTWRVHAAEALLDLLDDLVTVARLLVEQAKNHELQVPLVEHSSATEWTAARFAATTPKSPSVKPKVLRPRPKRPREPRPALSPVH